MASVFQVQAVALEVTGAADKCQGNPASCRRKHVREEALEARFTELLGRLRFDDEVLEWAREHCTPATPTGVFDGVWRCPLMGLNDPRTFPRHQFASRS